MLDSVSLIKNLCDSRDTDSDPTCQVQYLLEKIILEILADFFRGNRTN